jgi:hypothetical protein
VNSHSPSPNYDGKSLILHFIRLNLERPAYVDRSSNRIDEYDYSKTVKQGLSKSFEEIPPSQNPPSENPKTEYEPDPTYQSIRSPSEGRKNLCDRHKDLSTNQNMIKSSSTMIPTHQQKEIMNIDLNRSSEELMKNHYRHLNQDLDMIQDEGYYRPIRNPYEGFNQIDQSNSSPTEAQRTEAATFRYQMPPHQHYPYRR